MNGCRLAVVISPCRKACFLLGGSYPYLFSVLISAIISLCLRHMRDLWESRRVKVARVGD